MQAAWVVIGIGPGLNVRFGQIIYVIIISVLCLTLICCTEKRVRQCRL